MNDKLLTGWAQSGPLTSGDLNKVIKLQCQFPVAGVYTVQFNLLGATLDKYLNPVAEIVWSAAGNFVKRKVSVTNGVSITGVAEAVDVRVRDESVSVNVADPATPPSPSNLIQTYEGSIQVARGGRPSTQQPAIFYDTYVNSNGQRLIGSKVIANGAASDIPIPRDIGIISVYISPLNAITPATGVATSTATFLTFGSIEQGSIPFDTWAPVPPNAAAIRYRVNALSPYGSVDFLTAWGIDG